MAHTFFFFLNWVKCTNEKKKEIKNIQANLQCMGQLVTQDVFIGRNAGQKVMSYHKPALANPMNGQ